MIVKLAGLFLVFAVVLHLWTILYLSRLKFNSFLIPLHIYFNALIAVLEVTTIFFLQSTLTDYTAAIFKIHFISAVFVPPVLYLLNQDYSFGAMLPKFTPGNIAFFLLSIFLSGLALHGDMFRGAVVQHGIIYPRYSQWYWVFLLYFYASLFYTYSEFQRKYRSVKRRDEIRNLKRFVYYILPALIAVFAGLHFLPFWGVVHPAVFLLFPILTMLIIYISSKWNLLEFDKYVSRSISFFLITALYFLLWGMLWHKFQVLEFILLIPASFLFFLIVDVVQSSIQEKINRRKRKIDYDLDQELEIFTGEIGKFISTEELAAFVADYSRKILHCTKCAVITSRFDIHPYQIIYLDGFPREDMEQLITGSNSPLLEMLESEKVTLNKLDYPVDSAIYQMMDRLKIYFGIPLATQNDIVGFVFLGDDRKSMVFRPKDIRFTHLLSVQAANAIQNIASLQKVLQAQKMADLGVLASQLAHDFQSFVTLVKLDTPAESRIREHANYMEKLVQDLLNYARPQELRLNSVNINQLVDMTLDLIDIPANILLEKRYTDDLPAIRVDSDQMRRVFLNLLENSIRAMKDNGGRLKITTRPLRPISKLRRNPWIYIEFLDEGAGIPEEFLEKIFEPFFTTYKHRGGNGMGLAIVKQIITRHKGFIDVTSKEGKGTVFNIRLPYLI